MQAIWENGSLKIVAKNTRKAIKRPLAQVFLVEFVDAVRTDLKRSHGCSHYLFQVNAKLPMTQVNDVVRGIVSEHLDALGAEDAALAVCEHERDTIVSNSMIHLIADLAVAKLRNEAGAHEQDETMRKAG